MEMIKVSADHFRTVMEENKRLKKINNRILFEAESFINDFKHNDDKTNYFLMIVARGLRRFVRNEVHKE